MITLPNPFMLTDSTPRSAEKAAASFAPVPIGDAAAVRFNLDVARFFADIEPAPAFISAPRPEYLKAADLMPVLAALAGH